MGGGARVAVQTDAPVETAVPAGRWPLRRVVQLAILALPLVFLAAAAWRGRNLFEDGFIYLRVAQNVLDGYGPVFNPGDRVETYTGPLWLAYLVVAGGVTPWRFEWVAVISGIVMTLGAVGLALGSSARLARLLEPRSWLLPLGAIAFVVLPPVWVYASTGLETGLTFLWLASCLWVLVRWSCSARSTLPWWALIVLGLGPLIRPELAVTSGVLACVVIGVDWARQGWLGRARTLAWIVAVPVLYEVFRLLYFGMLVSNTAVAKEGTRPRPDAGIAYLADFVGPYWLWLPVAVLMAGALLPLVVGLWGERRAVAAAVALPVTGVINAAFVTVFGGDYLHARLYLPALFAIVAPVAAVPLARRFLGSLLVLPWSVVCLLWLHMPQAIYPFGTLKGGDVTLEDFGYGPGGVMEGSYRGPGLAIRDSLGPIRKMDVPLAEGAADPTVIIWGIGSDGYYLGSGTAIYDRLGLANLFASHLDVPVRGHTGHEKEVPTAWIAAALTPEGSSTAAFDRLQQDRAQTTNIPPLIPLVTGKDLAVQTAWARAALKCPAIADLDSFAKAPLTAGQMANNLTHAVGRTTLRIPADPETAYREFCGPGTPEEVTRALAP